MLKIKLKKMFCYAGAILSLGALWSLTSCSYIVKKISNFPSENKILYPSDRNLNELLEKYKKENNKNFFLNEKQIKELNRKARKIISKHYEIWDITNEKLYGPKYYLLTNEIKNELINKKQEFISHETVEDIIDQKQIIIKNYKEYKKYFPNYKLNDYLINFFKTHNLIAFHLSEANTFFNHINHIYPKMTNNKIEIWRFNLIDVNRFTPIRADIDNDYIFFFPYEKKYEIEFKNNQLKTLESMEFLFKINEENEEFLK
ncbi:hypothetical protein [[Mycoplasma] collis]|uniref:hypothetical protein n=1 Tax=[Mycoplasma] collis TaxID=2127 RepID=UPI00051C397B|nr:hypothetical protein [[Mycoplasma] collis]